jgi:hypothetical protein
MFGEKASTKNGASGSLVLHHHRSFAKKEQAATATAAAPAGDIVKLGGSSQ